VKSIDSGQQEIAPTSLWPRCFDLVQVLENRIRIGAVVKQRSDYHGPPGFVGELFEERDRRVPAFGEHEYARAAGVLQRARERVQLGVVGEARRHRLAAFAVVRGRGAGREADGAGLQPFHHQLAHFQDFLLRRGALGRRRAHDVGAHARMADEGGDVDRRAARLEAIEVFRHRLEVPAHAAAQHLERHALDLRQVAHHQLAVGGAAGRDGEAAVADDRGGDALRGRRRELRVPGDLRVVVRVVVDDARHQREAAGVDGFPGLAFDGFSDLNDFSVGDCEVTGGRRGAPAVQQHRAPDHKVVHRPISILSG
jgi:hypothetical protein